MISPRQIRAARALLDWSQQELADKAIISLNALTRLERAQVDPRVSTVTAVERALNKAGVEFIAEEPTRGEGVRLTKPGTAKTPASARKRKAAKVRRE
jgi:predicted transcriptional regulator